jgi:hypothetical protein
VFRKLAVVVLVVTSGSIAASGEAVPNAEPPPTAHAAACVRVRHVVFAITTSFLDPKRPRGNGCWPWERRGTATALPRCYTKPTDPQQWSYDDTDFGHSDDPALISQCHDGRGPGYEYMAFTAGRGWKKLRLPFVSRYFAELYRPVDVPFLKSAYTAWHANRAVGAPLINVGMGVRSDAAVAAAVVKVCKETTRHIGLFAGSGQGAVTLQRRGTILRALNTCTTAA